MDFLKEQFPSKESIEVNELISKLPELDEQLLICQKEVFSYLKSIEETLEVQPKKTESQLFEVKQIKDDLSQVKTDIEKIMNEDLAKAENDFKNLKQELEEVTETISIVHNICEIHERLAMLKRFRENYESYGLSVQVMDVLKMLIKPFSDIVSVPFIEELKKIVNSEIDTVNSLFKEEFKKNCNLSKEKNILLIKVPKETKILENLLPAIYQNNCTTDLISVVTNFVEHAFIFVIRNKCVISKPNTTTSITMKIEIINFDARDPYNVVYQNIITIIDFLEQHLNFNISDDVKLLNFIGTSIKSSLAKTALNECVLHSIPQQYTELEKFKSDLIIATKKLEDKLLPHDMFDDEWKNISKVDEFHKQNRCKYFNNQAKEIIKKDLHFTKEVGQLYDPKTALMESNEFLKCSISSNIEELIQLGQELIDEMCDGPEANCEDLFMTYKGIFFNYGDFVAAHHQKLLETIPQQVALFYNNCIYLSRKLKDWDDIFENHEIISMFCDDSSKAFYGVEEVGRMFFSSFVDDQKKQIRSILEETNLQKRRSLDKLDVNMEKLLRQCLRQQELLKTVWNKVLSYLVYNETIGDIFNSMCKFLIESIVVIEDIEAKVAENLIEIFKVVLNRGPKLFTDPKEISIYVPEWHKFNELIFVLGATLIDINDRWADGKGPLALQFKSYELKQLIRALFQNTERRAKVLARIHE